MTWDLGGVTVTRVADPGFELILPSDEATTALLRRSPWLAPHFVTDQWSLRIGSSATVVRTGDATVLLDPFLAFDDPDRSAARVAALAGAGIGLDDVDVVILSHIDGWGVAFRPDGAPTFASARYLLPAEELDALRAGEHPQAGDAAGLAALERLLAAGQLELVPTIGAEPVPVAPRVEVASAPGHNPGHVVAWLTGDEASAVVVGHLFLHPAQIAAPDVTTGDLDPGVLAETRRALLARCAALDAVLVGPLFEAPGGGRVGADGGTWRLVP